MSRNRAKTKPSAIRTSAAPALRFGWDWQPILLVAGVALAASVGGILNDFAMDDFHLISEDARVHSFPGPASIFGSPYWPAPFNRDLYRPLATLSFAVQWSLGGGSPVAFRVVSYLLYALTSLGVLALARQLLPEKVALGVALLFVAHPVHVEAVALGVNQGEQLVALLSVLVATRYLQLRRRGWPAPLDWITLAAAYLIACLFKENAVIMPGLLLAVELCLIRGEPVPDRALRLAPAYLVLAALGGAFLAVRAAVLDDFVGSFTAEALAGQSAGGRLLTMLQVVPSWMRLLLWPAHLLGDYSPKVIEQASSWGTSQTLGAALLASWAALAWWCRNRAPTVTFGVVWFAVALLPVSNVLLPTGIVLSERSLFLPSVGWLLALGGLVASAWEPERGAVSRALAAVACLLVTLGVVRSEMRQRDYADHFTFWETTVLSAPQSYRAQYAYAELIYARGDRAGGIRAYNEAIALHPAAYWVQNELGDLYKSQGECQQALDLYAKSLDVRPDQPTVRISRMACFVQLGRLEEAQAEANEALRVQEAGPRP